MERTIKFRGKSISGDWVYGDLIQLDDKQSFIAGSHQWAAVLQNNSLELGVDEVIPETIGQFTGLKDKNGVEIYEGDIVDWIDSDYNMRRDVVRWINGGLVLCNNRYTVGSYPQIEVIDNIYDNPERIMSKKLKDLNEHNAQARNMQWAMNDYNPRLNGIACPKCGEELYDSNPLITLTSMPAQKNVHCSKCDYVGYRIA